jgi:twitching motility protein PilT
LARDPFVKGAAVTVEISKLLDVVIREGGSDIHLCVGRPPVIRLHGSLRNIGTKVLTPDDTTALMKSITNEKHQQEIAQVGGADFGFTYNELARFRVSVYKQKSFHNIVLRLIPSRILNFEEIGLPDVIKDVCRKPRGIVLITGPTGSGKTTTLATMIDFINIEEPNHILTIEDPIEYYHNHKRCIITQRELGVDVFSFPEALRRGLRSDPDIILVGEMRDNDTMETAILAAETGHLVFATTHTTGSSNTVNRIVDAFPKEKQEQIRTQLSVTLEAVISQLLIPTADGKGRVAAFEFMFMTDAIANLIRKNETFRINSVIQTSGRLGMQLLDDALFNLWSTGRISFEQMMMNSQAPDLLQQKVSEFQSATSSKKR